MGGGRGPRPRQTRGQDALVPLDIDLSTAVFGGNADLVIDTAVGCPTCHGSGVADGSFAMPSPQVPALPASEEAFAEYIKDPEHARWSQFMIDKVWPKMADLLQVDKFEPKAHPDGFSCHNCHTLLGP